MSLTEREKKVFRDLLNNAKITEEELLEAGYYGSEMVEIRSDKERFCVYDNVEEIYMKNIYPVISRVLGKGWKSKYDYKEERRKGRYGLYITMTEKEFNEICNEAADEREMEEII